MKYRLRVGMMVAGFAAALAACDSNPSQSTIAGPSSTAAVTAKIVHSSATRTTVPAMGYTGQPSPGGAFFVGSIGQPCAAREFPLFDLLVTAGRPASLSRVTIQLIDGSSPGASITFPQPGTNANGFQLAAGATQTFTFQPTLGCGALLPGWITATVGVIDPFGPHTITASASIE